jgi:fructose-specific phosphotransferase system IIC component
VIEVAGAIVVAVLVLVYLGQFAAVVAGLFGVLLVAAAGGLVYFLRLTPEEVAWGIVAASIVIGTIYREANSESKRAPRTPQRIRTD